MILESSPESVLTITESDCIANAEYYEKARELILRKLTSTNRRVFLYICLFLRELQKNYHLNRLDDKILGNTIILIKLIQLYKNNIFFTHFSHTIWESVFTSAE